LIDTVHIENVNVPSTRDRLRDRFGVRSSLVGSGGFILGLNCIANRFGSGDLFLRRDLLTPDGRRRKKDKHRDGGATPNGVFHAGILSAQTPRGHDCEYRGERDILAENWQAF